MNSSSSSLTVSVTLHCLRLGLGVFERRTVALLVGVSGSTLVNVGRLRLGVGVFEKRAAALVVDVSLSSGAILVSVGRLRF